MDNDPVVRDVRIIVCGGRLYTDERHIKSVLDALLERISPHRLVLIVGGAPGADAIAKLWGENNPDRVTVIVEKAEWTKHGRGAGPIRNKRMIDTHKPDMVVAFLGGRGTQNMVSLAHRAGIKIVWGSPPPIMPAYYDYDGTQPVQRRS